MSESEKIRCPWAKDETLAAYHDAEWGLPLHDDRLLFEFLVLGGAQAGLSWSTILNKREAYRRAFDAFDPEVVARYDKRKRKALMQNPGIVRNERKLASAINNARAFLAVQQQHSSFDRYIWLFTDGRTIHNAWQSVRDVPARTPQSDAMSKDLKRLGFTFVGSTICYAFMQAIGMVNDHLLNCFRHAELEPETRRRASRRK